MTTQKAERLIEVIANDLTYLPIPEQRKVKTAFWSRFNDNPSCEPQDITLAVAQRYVGDSRLDRWWSQAGFKEWFRNREEFRERIENLVYLAMDTLERVLIDEGAQASAKVNAAKLLMEVGRKMPPRHAVEKYIDSKVAEMDRAQLEAYIARNRHLIQPATEESNEDSSNPS